MVYDKSSAGGAKKERKKIEGKMISLSFKSEFCKNHDKVKGTYDWLEGTLVTGLDDKKEPIYFNFTLNQIDMQAMPELKKVDELLIAKKQPQVEFEYYTTEKTATKDGKILYEEETIIEDGKEKIFKKEKKWENHKCSKDDITNTFKVLQDDVSEPKSEEPTNAADKEEVVK